MKLRDRSILLLLLLQFTVNCFSQNVQNFSYKIVSTKVEVSYDLVGEVNDGFNIALFSSIDDFQRTLQQVSGDVGENVKTGSDKLIIWDARQELGDFKGNISLRLITTLIPCIEFTNLTSGTRFKRGKRYELTWTGGSDSDIQFELYKGLTKVEDLQAVPNDGKWEWDIPKDLKSGKDYKIKSTADGRTGFSPVFRISPKIPLVLKALPIALVGGVVYIIISSGSTGDAPENNDIADPFLPE